MKPQELLGNQSVWKRSNTRMCNHPRRSKAEHWPHQLIPYCGKTLPLRPFWRSSWFDSSVGHGKLKERSPLDGAHVSHPRNGGWGQWRNGREQAHACEAPAPESREASSGAVGFNQRLPPLHSLRATFIRSCHIGRGDIFARDRQASEKEDEGETTRH